MSLISKEKKDAAKTSSKSEETTASTKKKETKAVAKKSTAAAPAKSSAPSVFIQDPDVLEALQDTQDLPMIYASDGTHMCNGEDIGKTFKYFGVSQKIAYKLDPGSTDDEAEEYTAWSEDGETTFKGESLQEIMEEAKEAGYSKTKIKEYIMITAIISEYDNSNITIDNNLAVFRIAPGSQWDKTDGYRSLEGRLKRASLFGNTPTPKAVTGIAIDCEAVEFQAEAKVTKWDGNSFTKSAVTLAE